MNEYWNTDSFWGSEKSAKPIFFCNRHSNHFTDLCIGCLDDIFHHGFGMPSSVVEVKSDEWAETFEYIAGLKEK